MKKLVMEFALIIVAVVTAIGVAYAYPMCNQSTDSFYCGRGYQSGAIVNSTTSPWTTCVLSCTAPRNPYTP